MVVVVNHWCKMSSTICQTLVDSTDSSPRFRRVGDKARASFSSIRVQGDKHSTQTTAVEILPYCIVSLRSCSFHGRAASASQHFGRFQTSCRKLALTKSTSVDRRNGRIPRKLLLTSLRIGKSLLPGHFFSQRRSPTSFWDRELTVLLQQAMRCCCPRMPKWGWHLLKCDQDRRATHSNFNSRWLARM